MLSRFCHPDLAARARPEEAVVAALAKRTPSFSSILVFRPSFHSILDCIKVAGIRNVISLLVVFFPRGRQTWSSKYRSDMKCT